MKMKPAMKGKGKSGGTNPKIRIARKGKKGKK